MSGFRRRLIVASQNQNNIPVWDGTTITTPVLVDGFYQIYDGPTLVGFNALAIADKKGKVVADFALNSNWQNYDSWILTPPPNNMPLHSTSTGLEFDGGGHTIYGLRTSYGLSKCLIFHHIKIHGSLFTGSSGIFSAIGTSSQAYACQIIGNLKATGIAGFFGYKYYQTSTHDLSVYGSIISDGSIGCFFGTTYGINIKNCFAVGTVNPLGSSSYPGGFWGYDTQYSNGLDNCFESVNFVNTRGAVNAFGHSATPINYSYYDTNKIGSANPQGLGKTTQEIKSQAFVDLLNAHVPAGSFNWKLETTGLLAGWPVHNF